jgi:hypothetical protein
VAASSSAHNNHLLYCAGAAPSGAGVSAATPPSGDKFSAAAPTSAGVSAAATSSGGGANTVAPTLYAGAVCELACGAEVTTICFYSHGIRTKIGTCSYFTTFQLECSSDFLIWAAT